MNWWLTLLTLALSIEVSVASPKKKVLVLEPEITGKSSPALSKLLVKSCEEGLKSKRAQIIPHSNYQNIVSATPSLRGCVSGDCLARLSKAVRGPKPNLFIQAAVNAIGSNYLIQIRTYTLRGTRVQEGSKERNCTVCTTAQLAEAVKEATADAFANRGPELVPIVLESEPGKAKLSLDDKSVGVAPVHMVTKPGKHKLSAKLRGYRATTKEINVPAEGIDESFIIKLSKDSGSGASGSRFGAWKWVMLGGTLAAAGAGTTLLVLDGRGTCSDPNASCPRVYDTKIAGYSTIGGAVLLGAVTTYMFIADKPNESPTTTVSISPQGAYISRSWTF